MKLCLLFSALSLSFAASAQLVELIKLISTIKIDVKYATKENFTGKILYPSSRVYLEKVVANALIAIQKKLQDQGLGLKVFDGYRPQSVQQIMWDTCPNQRKYIRDPKLGSNHSRGTAVDLTIIDLTKEKELEMPSGYDDLSPKAHRTYETMQPNVAKNCKLLETLMVEHGFSTIPHEWWHFNWADSVKYPEKYPVLNVSFDELERLKK